MTSHDVDNGYLSYLTRINKRHIINTFTPWRSQRDKYTETSLIKSLTGPGENAFNIRVCVGRISFLYFNLDLTLIVRWLYYGVTSTVRWPHYRSDLNCNVVVLQE